MSIAEFFRELAFPARSLGTMVSLITFYLLGKLAASAGLLGIWLAVMVVPAMFRYLILLAQARARGIEAEPPGIEYFSLVGNWWTLFPAVPAFAAVKGWLFFTTSYGVVAAVLFGLAVAAIVPAMMAVLMITRSPAQSLNPLALWTLVRECGRNYWYAPATLGLVLIVPTLLSGLPSWLQSLVGLYLVFAFYAVTGAITRHKKLIDEVYIDDPMEPDVERQLSDLAAERMSILNHAYGFVSRGNRASGLEHIDAWLRQDPDPDGAWAWFMEQMLKWEHDEHALFFAQRYLSRLLALDDTIKASKLILRCRLVDERFRPCEEDLPAAIDAAQRCGNAALAEALKRL